MTNICIIPARAGSKRIKNKNIKLFNGQPIISRTIKIIKKLNIFDKIIVSTDSKKIASISSDSGVDLILKRSKKLSNDKTSTIDVIRDVLLKIGEKKKNSTNIFCIYPTSVFIQKKYIISATNLLKKKKYDFIFSGVKFSYPIERSFKNKHNKVKMIFNKYRNKRTQNFSDTFHDAAQFYLASFHTWFKFDNIFTKRSRFIELDQDKVQDIDNITDWKIAEFKFNSLNKN